MYIAFHIGSYCVERLSSYVKCTVINNRSTDTAIVSRIITICCARYDTTGGVHIESISIRGHRIHIKCTTSNGQIALTRHTCLVCRLGYICDSAIRTSSCCFYCKLRISTSCTDSVHYTETIRRRRARCSGKITTFNMCCSVRTNRLSIGTGTGGDFKRAIVDRQGRTIPFCYRISTCLETIIACYICAPCLFGRRMHVELTSIDRYSWYTGIYTSIIAISCACYVTYITIHMDTIRRSRSSCRHIEHSSIDNHVRVIRTSCLIIRRCTISIDTLCCCSSLNDKRRITCDSSRSVLD